MKKSINYIDYKEVLTDNEILLYSKMIIQFKNNEIDFLTLKSIFENYGLTIYPILNDFTKKR